jgi:hypothetical protein
MAAIASVKIWHFFVLELRPKRIHNIDSRFSFTKCPNLDVVSPASGVVRQPSPSASDIALRESLRNPAPPKSPPEVKKVLRKSQKNYHKRKEEAAAEMHFQDSVASSPLHHRKHLQQQQHQQQQHQHQQLQQQQQQLQHHQQQQQQQQQQPSPSEVPQSLPQRSQSFSQPVPGAPKHRNESAADRKPRWTTGSDDFSPFHPVSSVQQESIL